MQISRLKGQWWGKAVKDYVYPYCMIDLKAMAVTNEDVNK